jgi:hypothetical protein
MPEMQQRLPRAVTSAALAALLALPWSAEAQGGDLPAAGELVDQVLGWAAEQHARKVRYDFRRLADVERLDRNGKVEAREQREYRSVQIDGQTYDRLIAVDGAALDEDESVEEREREARFREQLAERKPKGDEPFFGRDLADRYAFRVLGRELIRGRQTFVMSFEPDTGKDLPEDEDEDRFLNALAGKIWIDAEEHAIARIHARLTHTVRFGLGLLAYFKKIDLKLDLRRAPTGAWLPHEIRSYVWGRSLLLKPIRTRERSRFVDYRRAT